MMPSGPVLGDAILRLCPSARFVLQNEDLSTIEWLSEDVECPSSDEIMQAFGELEVEFSAHEYRRQRQGAYPPIGDQLDDLFKAGLFSDEMAARIQAVKDAYPKG